MQHVSIPLSRALSDLLVRAGAPADRAIPNSPGAPAIQPKPTDGCSLCGASDHHRSACPWEKGL